MELPLPECLEGSRVRLEPLKAEHLSELFAAVSDPELWRYIPTMPPAGVEALPAKAIQRGGEDFGIFGASDISWVVIDRESGAIAGTTSFMDWRGVHRGVEIGFTITGKRWQRTGINREAKYLLMRYGFETLDLLRVCFKTDARNHQSQTALSRLGAQEEGRLRSHVIMPDGYRRDTVYFSVLKEEWPEVKNRLEARMTQG